MRNQIHLSTRSLNIIFLLCVAAAILITIPALYSVVVEGEGCIGGFADCENIINE